MGAPFNTSVVVKQAVLGASWNFQAVVILFAESSASVMWYKSIPTACDVACGGGESGALGQRLFGSRRRQLHQLALDKRLQLGRQGLQTLGPLERLARLGRVVVGLQCYPQAHPPDAVVGRRLQGQLIVFGRFAVALLALQHGGPE